LKTPLGIRIHSPARDASKGSEYLSKKTMVEGENSLPEKREDPNQPKWMGRERPHAKALGIERGEMERRQKQGTVYTTGFGLKAGAGEEGVIGGGKGWGQV